ncbi:MAG: NAD-dependent epimerase/dehydratase family protein [Candidatus Kapaibacterium sp.]|jgi:nucleoside-diphosphate-sugar epimerase
MQTILGAGGAIGIPLAKELSHYTPHIRLVSRKPKKVNDSDELYPADLHDSNSIDSAVAGSDIVYVTVGFEYRLHVWEQKWVPFMQAVIQACKNHNAKLVFFDNVYMYDSSAIPHMVETSPINAPSKKGMIRQRIHEMIMKEVENNSLNALIARSADFYGPDNKNSALRIMVVDNLLKGKKAQSFGNVNKIHTFTYTPDAAKATALLGNTPDAFHQVWHVPTTKERLTTLQWIHLIAEELQVKPDIQHLPLWMIKVLGIFIPSLKEFPEMMYQYEQDYMFDSSKFEQRFGITATAPKQGIRTMIESLKSQSL